MRTETPFATCSSTVERGESAASAEISSPRFIGPGCITMLSAPRAASRRASSPQRREYSRSVGKYAAPMRSSWIRSIMSASGSSAIASSRS